MKTVSAKYARQHFADILNEVHYGGEKVLITRSGKPLVIVTSTKEEQTEETKPSKKRRKK
jgi:prevent-host-death family protein